MQLLVRCYDMIELEQIRAELTQRGIGVHISDEFTYAIPGMPGAEQPRGLWVALDEDLQPARQVVIDLLGADRLEKTPSETANSASTQAAGASVVSGISFLRWRGPRLRPDRIRPLAMAVFLAGALVVIWITN